MTEEQFKQMMEVLNDILESTQNIEDAIYDANFKEHNEKVEWNLWEIHNLAKIKFKGSENRPSKDAERTQKSEESSES